MWHPSVPRTPLQFGMSAAVPSLPLYKTLDSRYNACMSDNMTSQQNAATAAAEVPAVSADDLRYMREAYRLAKKASDLGDVPIGCVIVYEGRIIARGYNRRNRDKTTLAHAEIIAIRKASKVIGDWRLENTTMYVTLEPCQMCAGAILQARIPRLYIGCMNPKAGCAGSIINLLDMKAFNHQVDITRGVMETECSELLTTFFKDLRVRRKEEL